MKIINRIELKPLKNGSAEMNFSISCDEKDFNDMTIDEKQSIAFVFEQFVKALKAIIQQQIELN